MLSLIMPIPLRRNRWLKTGIALVVLGWGPLIGIVVLSSLGLWPDPNPNPVGPGLLFFITFWPAVVCLAVGGLKANRNSRGHTGRFES
jgi:hypothetical protein